MSKAAPFLLDSDVFIAAKNAYYAFDICPGFWSAVLKTYERGSIRSLDRIRNELLLGRKEEDLVQWVTSAVPTEFFLDSNADDVSAAFEEVMLWVQRNARYFDRAKAKFATEADGWLVAYSMVHGTVVVTNEQSRPESRNRVLLPDVCVQFNVTHRDTFLMLRELGVRFGLMGGTS
ncbi:MAG: DUF4411 family protein [Deltaproteobacteria bacterium]|nr:DUF4411 family protein [Deltaproteobacteria bacterium]